MFLFVLALGGFAAGLFMSGFLIPKDQATDNFPVYFDSLKAHGISIINQTLRVSDYKEVDFTEFIVVLKAAGSSVCYYDQGSTGLFSLGARKLWYQYDGIYYEVRK